VNTCQQPYRAGLLAASQNRSFSVRWALSSRPLGFTRKQACNFLYRYTAVHQAVVETARALKLNPLSLIIHASHAGAFWLARNWNRAIAHSRQALELDHNFTALHWLLAHGYQGKGMYEQAIDERQRAAELSGRVPVFIAELGGTYARKER
jgi:tetratricopeptide (TPR) repeat protein